jgi:hypothetical protein
MGMIGNPQVEVVIRDFTGLAANVDTHDQDPGGARVQVNAIVERPGELRARRGVRRLVFDSLPEQ